MGHRSGAEPTSRRNLKFGRPSFAYVLQEIARIWRDERDKVETNGRALSNALKRPRATAASPLSPDILDSAAETMLGAVDGTHGGLAGAPKFPQTSIFEFLWRRHLATGRPEFGQAVIVTLTNLCQGGIYDHLGGGFSRYAVDHRWLVPHFEKMLYDNALLVSLLSHIYKVSREPLFRIRIEETVGWLLDEMRSGGAFAASYDADSEGEEGKFYVWSEAELRAALDPAAFDLFSRAYDVTPGGNWEGHTILNRLRAPALLSPSEENILSDARRTLFDRRRRRVPPGFDDKVLADWNGLAISGLVNAGLALSRPDWLIAARDAYSAILGSHWRDGVLWHSWRDGQLRNLATVDGYAHLAAASLRLHAATADHALVESARSLVDAAVRHLWDPDIGAFHFSPVQEPPLIVRPHYGHDDAVPNGNATMIANLGRLYLLTGEPGYRDRAESILSAYGAAAAANPFAYATLLNSFDDYLNRLDAVIVGEPDTADASALQRAIHGLPAFDPAIAFLRRDERMHAAHPAHGKVAAAGQATAYLCRGTRCSLPVVEPAAVATAFAALA